MNSIDGHPECADLLGKMFGEIRDAGVDHTIGHSVCADVPRRNARHVGTMLGLIREGLGMGVLSKTLLERFDMNGLTFRPIDSPSAFRTICLMTSASRNQTPAIDAFLKVCMALPRDTGDIATDIGQVIDAKAFETICRRIQCLKNE